MKGIIQRKNGYFYFRKTIPEDIRALNSARDILISLGTKSEIEAKIKADPLIKLSSYLFINARQEKKKIMFRATSAKTTDLCLNFMASVVIGDMKVTFEGETNEVVTAVNQLKQPTVKEQKKPEETIQFYDSEFVLGREEEYFKYLKNQNYSPQTIDVHKTAFQEFKLYLKDKRISDLNTKVIKQVVKILFSMPIRKRSDKDLQSILNKGRRQRSYLTSKNQFSILRCYFSYLVRLDLLETNPLTSDLLPPPPKSFDSTNFANFTKEDLTKIFSDKLLTASKFYAFHYWVCVLGLLTGARLAEIMQLSQKDVYLDAKVPYISINNSDNKLIKNKSSIRVIPLHPTILELGFEEYCETVKKEGYDYLFPDNVSFYRGKPSANPGVWFHEYLANLEIADDNKRRKVFHSFRHTFITEMQRMGAPLEIRQSIAGHTTGVITIDVYGERTQLETMYEWLKRIDFGIDIPKLENNIFQKRTRKKVYSKYSK